MRSVVEGAAKRTARAKTAFIYGSPPWQTSGKAGQQCCHELRVGPLLQPPIPSQVARFSDQFPHLSPPPPAAP